MQKLVFTNGNGLEIDLTSGNFGITNWAGLSNTSLNIQTQQVPFEDGGVFLDALMEQREIELTVAIYDGNNLALRYQKKRELISALNPKAGEGVLVYTNDYLTRQIKAVPQLPIFENKNSNDSGTLKASVVFSCPSPYWEDVEETEVVIRKIGTTVINNGDVPTQIRAKIEQNDILSPMQNPTLSNYTSMQSIGYEGSIVKPFYIDTELGNKKFYLKEITCDTLLSGESAKIIKSDYYRAYYLLQGDEIKKSTDGRNFTSIYQFSDVNIEDIIIVDSLVICYGTGNTNTLFISIDGENFTAYAVGSIYDMACKVRGSSFYLVVEQDVYKYCSGNLSTGVIQDFTEITLPISNYSKSGVVYNPYLDRIIIITRANYIGYCYASRYGDTWEYLGEPNHGEDSEKILYIPATHTMVHYGSMYGYLETSVDGVTWENKDPLYADISNFNYIDKTGLYIALGSVAGADEPYLAVSQDMNEWEVIETTYTSGGFTGIEYNELEKKYILAGLFDGVCLASTDLIDEKNIIDKMSVISDLSFCLNVGANNLMIVGNAKCTLTYRQKYIGV